jgi:ABC-2 type transport system ATP-binding protein
MALRDLDLEVPRNAIFGFLGPNGAGKTTVMKLLLGLAKPTSGSGSIFGHDIARESTEIRRRVGYLAQEPRFYEHLSARETLRFTARFFYQGPKRLIEERVDEMLELVGLENKADRSIKGFSGGERQRLGIAQAQVNYPDLLILDEPAASLDPMGRHAVLAIMEELRKHATVFYSTHILDDVQRVSDSVAILNRGELIAQAPISELLAGSSGVSYTLSLRGNAKKAKAEIEQQPWTSSVTITAQNGLTTFHVGVTDEGAAEEKLLRLVLQDPEVSLTEFRRKSYALEEIFMRLIKENSHDR